MHDKLKKKLYKYKNIHIFRSKENLSLYLLYDLYSSILLPQI